VRPNERGKVVGFFLPAAMMGLVAVGLAVWEWDFHLRARAGRARVVSSGAAWRSGQSIADVVHEVDGRPVGAKLRAWYRPFEPHEEVDVLYLPDNPRVVTLDRFWRLHFGSSIALILFGILAVEEAFRFADWRRRQESLLLRDGA
jgi:hypothetical protein